MLVKERKKVFSICNDKLVKTNNTSKYIAKIAFQIVSGDGKHTPQFDEQFRIFEAKTENEALIKARAKGKEEEVSFLNEKHENVSWKFIGVLELLELKDMADGAQIYATTEEAEDAASYINIVKQKERTIETLSNFVYIF
ncbi:MAG: DUF4288 domain-containing protein [Bacteroidia bacterium]